MRHRGSSGAGERARGVAKKRYSGKRESEGARQREIGERATLEQGIVGSGRAEVGMGRAGEWSSVEGAAKAEIERAESRGRWDQGSGEARNFGSS